MAKDAKIQPLAVRLTAIAGSFRSAEDVISVSDPLVKQLENVVNELTVELAGGKPNLPRNGQRGKAANANHRARGSRDKRRQHEYATVQQLWEKEPKQLATLVVEDRLSDIEQRRQPELPSGTTLIPKDGKDLTVAASWRTDYCQLNPSQTVLGVIDESLRGNIELSRAQKGFTHDEGAAQNVSLFRQTLKAMKEEQGGTCSILDISKAFDTVPHGALVPALRRLGVAPYIAEYVDYVYQDCQTVLPSTTEEIKISLRRGVKQGDPLSPLLWNAVVDPLLTYLDQREGRELSWRTQCVGPGVRG
ncbi:unnamed protein product [Acanthoscelides obtectus]|uniref:Reverse transcriptase domain-containing protein n=1 Tax=Acanthoscelides obtectus TaxID=200917 RepID=A0A9P0QEC3_ACAOB|nr:unnamed protein product [Acanthoscelides obtectus]CAK1688242.1 hypothetical protein AOBTE_LOCUS36638 [Acanthoscelides obtectus]